jgi:hypothetical protein
MEPDQNPINSAPTRRRSLRARIEDVALAVEAGVLWRLGDAVKAVFAVLLWPFERLAWVLQRGLIWPLQDRAAGFSGAGRVLAVAGSAVLVGAIGAATFVLATSDRSTAPAVPQVVVVEESAAEVSPPPAPKKPAPTLHGAKPVFKPATAKAPAKVGSAKSVETAPAEPPAATSSSPATDRISSSPTSSAGSASASAAAETSAIPGPAAGAKAIAVAREFSSAFVVYETGGARSTVREGFAATATPDLAKALLKRPPRLPADVKVPQAKIVNIVPGPSQGSVYTVSVSLLRVGVTSELRLEMEKVKGEGWRVTNVLG